MMKRPLSESEMNITAFTGGKMQTEIGIIPVLPGVYFLKVKRRKLNVFVVTAKRIG